MFGNFPLTVGDPILGSPFGEGVTINPFHVNTRVCWGFKRSGVWGTPVGIRDIEEGDHKGKEGDFWHKG